jgi:hypothetical protein
MKAIRLIFMFLCAACAWPQTLQKTPERETAPDWLESRWRARIAQDLARKGIVRSPQDPTVADLGPIFTGIKAALPQGKLVLASTTGSGPHRFIELQLQTILDETEKTRFLRVLDVTVEQWQEAGTVQERLVKHLRTPAIYEASPVQGPEPGELSYHWKSAGYASEIFIRANVLAAVHCMGSTERKTPFNPRLDPYVRSERSSVPVECSNAVSNLAMHIDRLLEEQLSQH